jgi:glycerol-3-phosphate dehydrogenase
VTYINRLYLAMGKGARHVAMTAWMLQFAGVMANEDKKSQKQSPFLKDAAKKVNLEQGAKKPWFLLKPSTKPDDVVDVYALTLAVLKKAAAEGKQIVNGEMVVELQALAEKYAPAEETTTAGDADPLAGAGDE